MPAPVVLITGGGQGIGRAIALALARAGCAVAINDILADTAEAVADEVRAIGNPATVHIADVSNLSQVEQMVADVVTAHGRIDALVNNAGIPLPSMGMHRLTERDWERVMAVNVKGPFNCTRAAAKAMIAQGGGRIVNLASVAGTHGFRGQVTYSTSKAAVVGLTKSSAKDLLRHGITVNAVAPGFIETNQTQEMPDSVKGEWDLDLVIGRQLGTADDIANCVAFLVSDDASFITGQVIIVDGGFTLGYP